MLPARESADALFPRSEEVEKTFRNGIPRAAYRCRSYGHTVSTVWRNLFCAVAEWGASSLRREITAPFCPESQML